MITGGVVHAAHGVVPIEAGFFDIADDGNALFGAELPRFGRGCQRDRKIDAIDQPAQLGYGDRDAVLVSNGIAESQFLAAHSTRYHRALYAVDRQFRIVVCHGIALQGHGHRHHVADVIGIGGGGNSRYAID